MATPPTTSPKGGSHRPYDVKQQSLHLVYIVATSGSIFAATYGSGTSRNVWYDHLTRKFGCRMKKNEDVLPSLCVVFEKHYHPCNGWCRKLSLDIAASIGLPDALVHPPSHDGRADENRRRPS